MGAEGRAQPVRVMLVEDNAAVRRAVAALLNGADDLLVCGEAATVAEAGGIADASAPDVVIVDLRLPDGTGVEAGRDVRAGHPQTRVLLLTSASEEEALVAAMLAGASGFLVKQLLGMELVGTVRAVAGGQVLIDVKAGASALHRSSRSTLQGQGADILDLVVAGRTNREISDDLGIEEATVRARIVSLASELADRGRALRTSRSTRVATAG